MPFWNSLLAGTLGPETLQRFLPERALGRGHGAQVGQADRGKHASEREETRRLLPNFTHTFRGSKNARSHSPGKDSEERVSAASCFSQDPSSAKRPDVPVSVES